GPSPAERLAGELAQARAAIASLPPFVARVALFLDAAAATVQGVVDALWPDLLQFHGSEAPSYCRAFGVPYIKAVPMGAGADPRQWAERYHDAAALLLDSHAVGEAGGSGKPFDWQRAAYGSGPALIVAGGLNADNVGAAIRDMRPYAVDVSSAVESSPGVKDPGLIEAFIEAVHRGNSY
ncbi:MAG: phosphoribosylanthranilate isomerase, partial [Salinisphaera sp.]|nr:phosphoribosylanthranilate isomerase [Salinisphaera sp.]